MTDRFQINREFRDLVASLHFKARRNHQAYIEYSKRFEELYASYNFTYEHDNMSTEQAYKLIRDIIQREDTRYFLDKDHTLIGAQISILKSYPYRSHLVRYVAQWYAEHERTVHAQPLALPQHYHTHVVIVDQAEVAYLSRAELLQAYATILRGIYLANVTHIALELPSNCSPELAQQLTLLARALMQGMVVAVSTDGSLTFYHANRAMCTGYIPARMLHEVAQSHSSQSGSHELGVQPTSLAQAEPARVGNFLNLETPAPTPAPAHTPSSLPNSGASPALTLDVEFASEYELRVADASEIVIDDSVVVLNRPDYSFILELVAIPDNILVVHSLTSPKLLYAEHFEHIACCYAQLIHNNKNLVDYINSHGYELVSLLDTIREQKSKLKENKTLILDLNHSSKVCNLLESLDHREQALLNQQLVALELYLQDKHPELSLATLLEQWQTQVASIADEQERNIALEDHIWNHFESLLIRNEQDFTTSIDRQYQVIQVGINPRPIQVECSLPPGTTIAQARATTINFTPHQERHDIVELYQELTARDNELQAQLNSLQNQPSPITSYIDTNNIKITKMHYNLASRIRSVDKVLKQDLAQLDSHAVHEHLEQLKFEVQQERFWYVDLPAVVAVEEYLSYLARVQLACLSEISSLIAGNYWWPCFEAAKYTHYPEARRYFMTLERIKRGIYHVYMIDDQKSSEIALQVANFKRTGVAELLICSNDLQLFERHNYSNAVVIDTNGVDRAFARVNQHFTLREMLEVAVCLQLQVQLRLNFNAFNLYVTQFDAQTAFSLLLLPSLREINMIETDLSRDAQQLYGYTKARNLVGQFKQLYPYLVSVQSVLNREHWLTDIFYSDNKEVYELLPLTGKRYQINFG